MTPLLMFARSLTHSLIIGVGPFIESEGLTDCTQSILSSDWNFDQRLDRTELNIAVAKWTDDQIPALTSKVSLPIQLAFNDNACVLFEECDSSFQECCEEGSDQYIPLDFDLEFAETRLFQLCANLDDAILAITDLFPTASPSDMPTPEPTPNPTTFPSRRPTKTPTVEPTPVPTHNPTPNPTKNPTESPTENPTPEPTKVPTANPTQEPTKDPTAAPTQEPTPNPTTDPTAAPSGKPTIASSSEPSPGPTPEPTPIPTPAPSSRPTVSPTANPTKDPTPAPSSRPTTSPTGNPTPAPSSRPTASPTVLPTAEPTSAPSAKPTNSPTADPSARPTKTPTANPTLEPTPAPTTSFSPTMFGRLKVILNYAIRTDGFDADAILNEVDNDILDDLLVAVSTIISTIVDSEDDPGLVFTFKNSVQHKSNIFGAEPIISEVFLPDDGGRHLRNLVETRAHAPVFHVDVLDHVCRPFDPSHNCVIVKTAVIVFLEPHENEDAVRNMIVRGFNEAVMDGSFFAAIPRN